MCWPCVFRRGSPEVWVQLPLDSSISEVIEHNEVHYRKSSRPTLEWKKNLWCRLFLMPSCPLSQIKCISNNGTTMAVQKKFKWILIQMWLLRSWKKICICTQYWLLNSQYWTFTELLSVLSDSQTNDYNAQFFLSKTYIKNIHDMTSVVCFSNTCFLRICYF